MRKLIAANWKMHGDMSWAAKVDTLVDLIGDDTAHPNVEVLICPPAHLIPSMSDRAEGKDIHIGAQNCHFAESGAYTGEMSADMCANAGADHIITGHSERREMFGDTNDVVHRKAEAIYSSGVIAIICIGESLQQRESGQAEAVIAKQLSESVPDSATSMNTVIAYEPIWAIGTGITPTLNDISDMHGFIRKNLTERFGARTADNIALQYGGSVKPANAKDILALPNVDGALVGGASLEMSSFAKIVQAAG